MLKRRSIGVEIDMTKTELKALLDEYLPAGSNPTIYLATCDATGPSVRPLSLVRDGLDFYFATSRGSEMAGQLNSRCEVGFVCLLQRARRLRCLRVTGRPAEAGGTALREAWTRAEGYDASSHFPGGLDDPDLVAFRVEPTRVRLRLPGEREASVDVDLFR